MNNKKLCLSIAAIALSASISLQAQFNPDSFGSFHVVSTPDNSTEGANASGIAVSGEFHWDSGNQWLRVIVMNLAGTEDYPTGTLTSFGFNTPYTADQNAQVELWNFGEYPITGGSGDLDFEMVSPYNLQGMSGELVMDLGAITGPNPNGGFPHAGIQSDSGAFFDFNFANIDPSIDPATFSFDNFFSANNEEFQISFRFQDIGPDGDSDKFGGFVVVPEPSTYGIAGISLLCAAILVRRLRRTRQPGA